MRFKIGNTAWTLIGFFLVFLGILAFYNGFNSVGLSGILWFSYTALFLIGIGILTRNSYLIASQLNIILIPYIFWNIDFFYVLLTGNTLWGVTNYFFQPRPFLAQLISMQHVFIVPLALLAIYFIKLKRKDFWKLSIIQVAVFFFLVRFLSNVEGNVNCVFENCLGFYINPMIYPILWFLAYFVMIALTTFLMTNVKVFNKTKINQKLIRDKCLSN